MLPLYVSMLNINDNFVYAIIFTFIEYEIRRTTHKHVQRFKHQIISCLVPLLLFLVEW
jgi:hypothetical protein